MGLITNIHFEGLGWKSKVSQKRATFGFSISKIVAVGCSLKKGQTICCYLAQDEEKRPVLLAYLDGGERK